MHIPQQPGTTDQRRRRPLHADIRRRASAERRAGPGPSPGSLEKTPRHQLMLSRLSLHLQVTWALALDKSGAPASGQVFLAGLTR